MSESQPGLAPDQNHYSSDPTQRRGFIRLAWILGAIVVFGGQLVVLLKRFLTADAPTTPKGPVDMGPIEQFAPESVTHFWQQGFLLIRRHREILALSHQCPHNKCRVDYVPDRQVILCPCHGSRFDLTGAVLRGPARHPLRRYPVKVKDRRVKVELPS
jgi:nitrite reductase/ring-hydroxylating ferredoxin subunit